MGGAHSHTLKGLCDHDGQRYCEALRTSLIQLGGLGGRCKPPQRGSGQRPDRQAHFEDLEAKKLKIC
jgi:hypothetical protein